MMLRMLDSFRSGGRLGPSEGNTKSDMQSEYDFSRGERGKFYRDEADIHLPVYLDDPVRAYLEARAREKGVALNELVNVLLKQDIALIEAAK